MKKLFLIHFYVLFLSSLSWAESSIFLTSDNFPNGQEFEIKKIEVSDAQYNELQILAGDNESERFFIVKFSDHIYAEKAKNLLLGSSYKLTGLSDTNKSPLYATISAANVGLISRSSGRPLMVVGSSYPHSLASLTNDAMAVQNETNRMWVIYLKNHPKEAAKIEAQNKANEVFHEAIYNALLDSLRAAVRKK